MVLRSRSSHPYELSSACPKIQDAQCHHVPMAKKHVEMCKKSLTGMNLQLKQLLFDGLPEACVSENENLCNPLVCT